MKYFLSLLLCASALFAKESSKEKITLKNGSVITSKILKENESNIIIDVGSDLIKLDKNDIHSRKLVTEKKVRTGQVDQIEDIFTIGRRAVAPVKELVDRVNESVVMVKTPRGASN